MNFVRNEIWRKRILFAVAALWSIKYILSNFGIDGAFQTVMSYRLLDGDRLFTELLEPYQTSSFLCTLLEFVFIHVFGNTTGIVLFLQIMGTVVDCGVAGAFYCFSKKVLGSEKVGEIGALLIVLTAPKDIQIPEYMNMQVWLLILLALCIYLFFYSKKYVWVVFSAVITCGLVLSYLSCVLVFAFVCMFFRIKKEKKACLLYFAICSIAGILFIACSVKAVGAETFFWTIEAMFSLETSHSTPFFTKVIAYGKEAAIVLGMMGLTYVICRLVNKERAVKLWMVGICIETFVMVLFISDRSRYWYSFLFLAMIFAGIFERKKLSEERKLFFDISILICLGGLVSTLIFTNLTFMFSSTVAIVGALGSLAVIDEKRSDDYRLFSLLAVFVLAFRGALWIRPYHGQEGTIFDIGGIVREGPAKGLITDYMGAYIQNSTFAEWDEYISEGDNVFILGPSLDTLAYLNKDVGISAPSTVPTPDYNSYVGEYFERYPWKKPDVVIASCWYGELNGELADNTYLQETFLNESNYSKVIDGKYWRYYFR